MNESTEYRVETAAMEGNAILLGALAVFGFGTFPFVEDERWVSVLTGIFFAAFTWYALHCARAMNRFAVEVSEEGIRQLPRGRFLFWADVSGIRNRGDRLEIRGGAQLTPIRLYHHLERFDEALGLIMSFLPPLARPREAYDRPPLAQRRVTLAIVSGSIVLAVWLWAASISRAGVVLPLALISILVYADLAEIHSVKMDSRRISVRRRRGIDAYPWSDVEDVRFELEYVGKGQHRLKLLLDSRSGSQELSVAGVDPFELYQAIVANREAGSLAPHSAA